MRALNPFFDLPSSVAGILVDPLFLSSHVPVGSAWQFSFLSLLLRGSSEGPMSAPLWCHQELCPTFPPSHRTL